VQHLNTLNVGSDSQYCTMLCRYYSKFTNACFIHLHLCTLIDPKILNCTCSYCTNLYRKSKYQVHAMQSCVHVSTQYYNFLYFLIFPYFSHIPGPLPTTRQIKLLLTLPSLCKNLRLLQPPKKTAPTSVVVEPGGTSPASAG
jgi:hypothetical protein